MDKLKEEHDEHTNSFFNPDASFVNVCTFVLALSTLTHKHTHTLIHRLTLVLSRSPLDPRILIGT